MEFFALTVSAAIQVIGLLQCAQAVNISRGTTRHSKSEESLMEGESPVSALVYSSQYRRVCIFYTAQPGLERKREKTGGMRKLPDTAVELTGSYSFHGSF